MTVFIALCALILSALSVLITAAVGTLVGKPGGGPLAVAIGALPLSGASVLWVAVGLRMAGV